MVRSERPCSVDHEVGRALDQGPVALPGAELWAREHGAHQILYVVVAAAEGIREILDETAIGLGRDEMLRDLRRDELGRGWLRQDAIDHSLRVQRTGLAEIGDASLKRTPRTEHPSSLWPVDG